MSNSNAAARRMNDYWKHCIPSYGKTETKKTTNTTTPATSTDALIEEVKTKAIPQMIAEGLSRSDIEERLILVAPQYGLDPATLLDDLELPNDIE